MKHILIQPEYRWWLNETFIGSFFGVQAHFAQYNFGGTTPFTTVKNNRYQGNLIGCGVTYGHQWLLSTFWSLEASISVGYAHLTYDKYGPAKGDALIEKSHSNYVGVVNDKYVSISVDTDTAFETDGDTNDAIITVEYSDAPAVGEMTVEKKGEVLDGFKGGLLPNRPCMLLTGISQIRKKPNTWSMR